MSRSAEARKRDVVQQTPHPEARAKKVSITVDERVLHDVQRVAQRAGRTLSAQITEALARDLRHTRLQELISDYERQHGSISEAEMMRIRKRWQD